MRNRHEDHCTAAPPGPLIPRRARHYGPMSDSRLAPGSRVAIAGASGLIGSALARSLTSDGYEVIRLVRRAPGGKDEVQWDPEGHRLDAARLEGCAAVVNLAGAGVASRYWTKAYKEKIRRSRVLGTTTLADAVASLDSPPRVFVNGSAIGFYGDTDGRAVDESALGRGRVPLLPLRGVGGGDGCRPGGGRPHGPRPYGAGGGPQGRGLGEALPALQGGARGADGVRRPVLELCLAARRGGRDPAPHRHRVAVGSVQPDGPGAAHQP